MDVSEPSTSGFSGQSVSQSTALSHPENVRKRAAPPCFPIALMKRARSMMAAPDYNAISVLYVLRPGLNFNFVAEGGPSHPPVFTCKVSIGDEIFEGRGLNKKIAKLNAAENALKEIMCEADCAENVYISASSSSSSSLLKDSKGRNVSTTMVVKAEPVKKEPEPSGSSPLTILSSIRPGIQYFEIINSEDETLKKSTGLKLYRMGVVVDGERFEGNGTSKKLAKNYAAEAALKKLFGLECAHSSDGIPVFTGDSASWIGFKKTKHEGQEEPLPQVFGLPEGKHPLQMINELYPTVTYTFGENATAKSSQKFSAYITIEDNSFEGKGANKKIARLNAAVQAITYLKDSGLLEQRIWEKRKNRAGKPKWHKPQRPSFLKSNGKPFGPPKPAEEKLKDAVQKLKEKFTKVDYEIISESTVDNSEGEAVMTFTVSATVTDKTFTGDGTSKQRARLEAAEAALRGLGLWTEEDETVKEEIKRLEMDKSRFARMLYGTNRMKGSSGSGSRDWRSQGKSWVSGGVLGPNPLILPDSGSGGNFEDSGDGSQFGGIAGFGRNLEGQQNEFSGMGPPGNFNMGPPNEFGMMGPVDGNSITNRFGMVPQNNFEGPDGFRTEEQSGYGMGQSTDFRGCYDFGNNGNFSANQSGSYNNWWGQC